MRCNQELLLRTSTATVRRTGYEVLNQHQTVSVSGETAQVVTDGESMGKRDRLQAFTTRLRRELIRDLKVCSAQEEIALQKIVDEALQQWLDRRSSTSRI